MLRRYFVVINGQRKGPYLLEQLRSMWTTGVLTADALYCLEGDETLVPVHNLLSERKSVFSEEQVIPVDSPLTVKSKVEAAAPPVSGRSMPPIASLDPSANAAPPRAPLPKWWQWRLANVLLIFLCLGMTVCGPLSSIGELSETYDAVKKYPQATFLKTYSNIVTITTLFLIIYSFTAGVMLIARIKSALFHARAFFWCRMAVACIVALLPFLLSWPQKAIIAVSGTFFWSFASTIFSSAFWLLFLYLSKDVKAMYSQESVPA